MEMDNHAVRAIWQRALNTALDADTWGQSLEAIDEYEKLVASIDSYVPHMTMSVDETSIINKIRLCCNLRKEALSSGKRDGLKLDQIKKLRNVLANLFGKEEYGSFPVHLEQFASSISDDAVGPSQSELEVHTEADDKVNTDTESGGLLPELPAVLGKTTVDLDISSIGLKDAEDYIDARITVSIADKDGNLQGPEQTTPISNLKEDKHISFNQIVHLQKDYETIMQKGYVVFLEFKHWKPKKKKLSTRCWAFMEPDELAEDGPKALELYKKPTDFKLKRINLHSVKPLYLHLQVGFKKH